MQTNHSNEQYLIKIEIAARRKTIFQNVALISSYAKSTLTIVPFCRLIGLIVIKMKAKFKKTLPDPTKSSSVGVV
jgi:hypothetical protein